MANFLAYISLIRIIDVLNGFVRAIISKLADPFLFKTPRSNIDTRSSDLGMNTLFIFDDVVERGQT